MEERLRVLLSSKHRVNKFRCERLRERDRQTDRQTDRKKEVEGETSNLSEKG